tara:strand:+ start:458 stop:751 length:294 start_codon:yes stop_codon:yes gene_type:complete
VIHEAILAVYSNVRTINGDTKETITVLDESKNKVNVDWNKVQEKVSELQTAYDNNKYQRDRAIEYPSMADQLDDLYHNGIDGWKSTIKAVKDKYPKG